MIVMSSDSDGSQKVLSPFSHSNCVACSQQGLLQLVFYTRDQHSVYAKVLFDKYWQGYQGLLHGGIIAMILDSALAHCTFLCSPNSVTASLNLRYHRPVPISQFGEVRARCIKSKCGLSQLSAELVVAGDIYASATASFMRKSALGINNQC